MDQTRLRSGGGLARVVLAGILTCPAWPAAAAASRFASYDTEGACAAAHTFTADLCRTAFLQARAEYESKTPSFPTAALCSRRFSACMAWPPGAVSGKAGFRPRWQGVDIVDSPAEHSVTPAPGSTGRTIRFAARPLTEPRELTIRGVPPIGRAVPVPRVPASTVGRRSPSAPAVRQAARPPEPSAPPPPGSGFTYKDGVLTYPAPARFQPKNLPRPSP